MIVRGWQEDKEKVVRKINMEKEGKGRERGREGMERLKQMFDRREELNTEVPAN